MQSTLTRTSLCAPLRWTALAAALLLTLAALPAQAGTSCSNAAAWLAAHPEQLPGDLAELAAVPVAHRAGVFNALSASDRTALWTAHLEHFLTVQPQLSAEERQMVRNMRDLFDRPETVAAAGEASLRANLQRTVLAALQARLTSDEPSALLPGGVVPVQVPHCNCSLTLDDDCMVMFCLRSQSGCGPDTLQPCTGIIGD